MTSDDFFKVPYEYQLALWRWQSVRDKKRLMEKRFGTERGWLLGIPAPKEPKSGERCYLPRRDRRNWDVTYEAETAPRNLTLVPILPDGEFIEESEGEKRFTEKIAKFREEEAKRRAGSRPAPTHPVRRREAA